MEKPTAEHLLVVKHILRYIRGMDQLGSFYGRKSDEDMQLVIYSDNDLAGDIDDCESTIEVLFFSWPKFDGLVVTRAEGSGTIIVWS